MDRTRSVQRWHLPKIRKLLPSRSKDGSFIANVNYRQVYGVVSVCVCVYVHSCGI